MKKNQKRIQAALLIAGVFLILLTYFYNPFIEKQKSIIKTEIEDGFSNVSDDEEKRKALYAVNVIKEKRDGVIKGRTCADGSKQRKYLSADDSVASPTGSLDGFFATCAIDCKEKRKVVTYDVSGAFLQP